MTLDLGGMTAWATVGLLVGYLAGSATKGGAAGLAGYMTVGLVGAVLSGMVFGPSANDWTGLWGSVGAAFIGACVFISVVRFSGIGRARP
jgi:uncharacterized membrane protein YeaQ/YmgE (transglycosylase-associated protein family)